MTGEVQGTRPDPWEESKGLQQGTSHMLPQGWGLLRGMTRRQWSRSRLCSQGCLSLKSYHLRMLLKEECPQGSQCGLQSVILTHHLTHSLQSTKHTRGSRFCFLRFSLQHALQIPEPLGRKCFESTQSMFLCIWVIHLHNLKHSSYSMTTNSL